MEAHSTVVEHLDGRVADTARGLTVDPEMGVPEMQVSASAGTHQEAADHGAPAVLGPDHVAVLAVGEHRGLADLAVSGV